ncbi:MAG: GNAT family N-acetyltransferase [Burkholderiales bacterium]
MEAVAESLNDLERRHGFDGIDGAIDTSFAEFCLRDDPAGLWIAEDGREIIGFGFSWYAGGLWYLADLFVRPRCQQSGVGRALLDRTLQQAQHHGTSCRALITFAYNRVSLGLYMRHGMYPRLPLYELNGSVKRLPEPDPGQSLGIDDISGNESHIGALERIDRVALGMSRAKHHRFSMQSAAMRTLLIKDSDGDAVAYAYVSGDGHVGPVAVIDPKLMRSAVTAALTVAATSGTGRASVFLPGCCGEVLSAALNSGLRLGRTMVFLSSIPFGDWTRYAPRGPGYM